MSIMVIIILAVTLFIAEGTEIISPVNIIPYLYIGLLAPYGFYILIKKKSIYFPMLPSIFFGLFLIFSFISTIFYSVDKQISFELTLFYIVSYLIFVFFYNNKDLGKKYINLIIVVGSVIFTVIYLFNLVYSKIPFSGYQLVSSYLNNSHNHLGDFLGLGMVIFIYRLFNKKKERLSKWLVIFSPFFLLSFSRSAFLALIVVYLVILIKSKINRLFSFKLTFGLILIASTMIFFFSTVNEVKGKSLVGKFNQYLTDHFNLQTKEFTAGRIIYWKQGMTSFYQQPLFGVGPGNFGFLSKKYVSSDSQWYDFRSTETAHSLLPEILFENGLLAFIFFTGFVIFLIVYIFKSNRLESYLLLYLLLNFQTDYAYRIYSMFVLFMILAALVYEEKESKINRSIIYSLFSVSLLVIVIGILTSRIFLKLNRPDLSLTFYHLNKEAYPQMIIQETAKKGCQKTEKLAKNYHYVSSGYLPTLQLLSNYYEACDNKKMAIYMLDKAVEDNRFINFGIVKKDYLLKKEVYGKDEGSVFLWQILRGYDRLKYVPTFRKQVSDFCRLNKEDTCRKMRWW